MNKLQAMLMADFYKLAHREQYPPGTETVYSTWTPRASRIPGITRVVVFGIQGFIREYLVEFFHNHFFKLSIDAVLADYRRIVSNTLGIANPHTDHIVALHELGYMPLEITALPEGTLCPLRVPMMTVKNTSPEFFWLTNFLETLMSSCLWQPMTSATVAHEYRKILDYYASMTGGDPGFVQFQAHDFSMRGMSSVEAACRSGAGHLLSFVGTDTIPAITYLEEYYDADVTKELVGTSIPATEHSVMCAYGDDEISFKRLLTEIYPSGLFSVVSDTWDLWHVLTEILPKYKQEVLARNGKMVIRPDSGDPVQILCGVPGAKDETISKGVVELLWDVFGGTINEKGYKVLDSHVGVIYGDSISLDRCKTICYQLMEKGFASTNVVYGVGSYTYQYTTRDTFGFALKASMVVIHGKEIQIWKDPITDDGTKKSQRGRVAVVKNNRELVCIEGLALTGDVPGDQLALVFKDGWHLGEPLSTIRARLAAAN